MRKTWIEFGTGIAAGIAHDRVVVADGVAGRIEQCGRALVRRIALADLERSIRAVYSHEAVARTERCALGWRRRCFHQGLVLQQGCPARIAAVAEVVPDTHTEVRAVARDRGLGLLVEYSDVEDVQRQVGGAVERDRGR